jgi:hypothetical protein
MAQTNVQAFSGDVEISGDLNITGDVIATAGVDKVNLATDGTNANRSIIFSTGTSGAQPLKTDAGLTYNPSTNTLTVAGGVDKVDLATDGTNTNRSIIFSTGTSGAQPLKTDAGLTYNPSTNKLTVAGGLSTSVTPGSYLTGSAYNGSTARTFAVDATTDAQESKIVARDSNGDIFGRYLYGSYLNMSHGSANRNSDTVFYSSTDDFMRKNTASGMRSSLNVPTRTGGDASGTWEIGITGNAGSSTNVRVDRDDTGDTGMYLVMVNNATAENSKRLYMDNGLVYDNTNNRLTLNSMNIADYIYHSGDANTYFGFNAGDSFRIVENGSVALQVNSSSNIDIQNYIRHAGNTNTYMGFSADNTIKLRTNGSDRVTVYSGGNVGFTADVTISGEGKIFRMERDNFTYGLSIQNFVQGAGAVGHRFQVKNLSNYYDSLILGYNGYVGIGISPIRTLDVNGISIVRSNLGWSGQNSWSTNKSLQGPNNVLYGCQAHNFATYSSRKLKENIETIPDALSKVKRLRGVHYTWKQGQGDNTLPNPDHEYDQTELIKPQTQIGFIADEVAETFPTVCGFDDGFASSVDYGAITPVLVNAIKELDIKIGKSEASSDDRLKDNESYIRNAIKTLMKLKPQVYDKKESLSSNVYQHEAGLIAQDIWYDTPELRFAVKPGLLSEIPLEAPIRSDDPREDPDYSKWGPNPAAVDYNYLIPYTIKSIQEIVTELPRQKTQVEGITPANLGDYRGLLVSADTNELRNGIPRLSITQKSYDKKCFGIVSFSNTHTTDNEILIDTKSCGDIWVINSSNIESGDYLTSSNIVGYAMKQNDDILHNYTVAKSSIDCDFTPVQKTVKRVKQELSNVTYYVKTDLFEISKEQYDAMDDMYKTSREHSFYNKGDYVKVTGEGGYDKMEYSKDITNETDENNNLLVDQSKWPMVKTIWDIISIDEWNTLESNVQNTYSPHYSNLVTTQVSLEDYTSLDETEKSKCVFTTKTIYSYKIRTESKDPLPDYEPEIRQEYINVLDENGQLQWEDTQQTEELYKIRYLDVNGNTTDETNAVHTAALINCTHCF